MDKEEMKNDIKCLLIVLMSLTPKGTKGEEYIDSMKMKYNF